MIEKKKLVFEKTVLVGVISARQDEDQALEYLAELAFLAHTAGGEVIKQYTQKSHYQIQKHLLEVEN